MSGGRVVMAAVVAAVIGALPFISDNYILRIATSMLMWATLAVSWNFIGGFAGYPSFATAAFFGLGAYAGAVLQTKGVPMIAAWIVAGIIVTTFAAAVGVQFCISAATTLQLRRW